MAEYRFRDDFPFTPEWYEGREHAPHLDQPIHQERLQYAARLAAGFAHPRVMEQRGGVVDLGCGDGGLLSLIRELVPLTVPLWGYDLQPSNVANARPGIDVRLGNFLEDEIEWADAACITECLEHLWDPHAAVRKIAEHCQFVVASSPFNETPESHDGLHMWGWDTHGFVSLFEQADYRVLHHWTSGGSYRFQAIGAVRA